MKWLLNVVEYVPNSHMVVQEVCTLCEKCAWTATKHGSEPCSPLQSIFQYWFKAKRRKNMWRSCFNWLSCPPPAYIQKKLKTKGHCFKNLCIYHGSILSNPIWRSDFGWISDRNQASTWATDQTKPITAAKGRGWNGHRFVCVPQRS